MLILNQQTGGKMGRAKKLVGCFWLTVLFGIFTAAAWAAPFRFLPVELKQPDGRVVHCFLSGDEYFSWYHDGAGYTILRDKRTGFYVYAIREGDRIVPSEYVVGRTDPQAVPLEKWTLPPMEWLYHHRRLARRRLQKMGAFHAPRQGEVNNLVIFVHFQDQSGFDEPISKYEAIFNDTSGTAGSVYRYFKEISYGKFTVRSTFYPQSQDGKVASVQDPMTYGYYASFRSRWEGPDPSQTPERYKAEEQIIVHAVKEIQSQVPPDLNIDINDDGYVDLITIIACGKQTSWGGLLWPHAGRLSDTLNISIHGKKLGHYIFLVQKFAQIGVHTGTVAHEILHPIGLPDLYRYENKEISPVGEWDVMATAYPGPPYLSAYMRYKYAGWIDRIPEITQDGTYTLNPLQSPANNCYSIPSPFSDKQFFVVEYRRNVGVFEYNGIPGSGLIFYRIDTTNGLRGNGGGPPDEVYVYRPGGTLTQCGETNHAYFSKESGRTVINDGTDPRSFLQDGSPGGLNVFNIGSAGEIISFDVSLKPAAFIYFVSPSNHFGLNARSTITLRWNSFGVQDFYLDFSADGGKNWKTVAGPIAADSCQWTAPDMKTPSGLLRIRSGSDPTVFGKLHVYVYDKEQSYPLAFNMDIADLAKCNWNGGVTWVDSCFWISRWNANIFYRIAADGQLLEQFSLPVRYFTSLTYDGQKYIYGVSMGRFNWVFKIDVASKAIVDSIYLNDPYRFYTGSIFYDSAANGGEGGLWLSDGLGWLGLFDYNGNLLKTLRPSQLNPILKEEFMGISSFVIDRQGEGGPYLWMIGTGPDKESPRIIYQIHMDTGELIAMWNLLDFVQCDRWNVIEDLFLSDQVIEGKVILGGLLDGQYQSRLYGFDITNRILPTGVAEEKATLPDRYALSQNYPNPFNLSTVIHYELPEPAQVTIQVLNLLGQEVATLVNRKMAAGRYTVRWNGTDGRGNVAPTGVYFIQMKAGSRVMTRKMLLLK